MMNKSIERKLLTDIKNEIEELQHYKTMWFMTIDLMKEFQTGGKYSSNLKLGDSTVLDGIKFLLKEYERTLNK